jgi:hypothetical protein
MRGKTLKIVTVILQGFKRLDISVCLICSFIHIEHERTLHFQNDTENKCGVLRTSLLHQSIKNTRSFVSNDPGDCCCCAPPLVATSFENGYPTTEELVCSAVSEEIVRNSCATCISHTILHGTTHPSIYLR